MKENSEVVGGGFVSRKYLYVVFKGKKYTKDAIEKQISFDIKRDFLKSDQELSEMKVGEEQDFSDENGKFRFTVKNTIDGVFEIIDVAQPEDIYNPRNNPTPLGAENESFGRGFAALGGNSYPKQ